MKRFIIKLFASRYHYWVFWKRKREDAYSRTFLFISFTFTLLETNLDILTGGHLLYFIIVKIGGWAILIAPFVGIEVNYLLLKRMFPVKRIDLAERRLTKTEYYIYHTIFIVLEYGNLFLLFYLCRLAAKM